jgi:type II secretory pathway component PulM
MDIDRTKENIKVFIDRSREKLQTLLSTDRDRRAALIGGATLVLVVLYLIFHSFSSGTLALEKRSVQLEKELEEVKVLKAEYENSNKKIAELSSKIKNEDEALISVVEKILLDEKLDRNNFSIRDVNTRTNSDEDFYEEKSVDVELNKISLSNLVDILYKFQNKTSLKVSNVSISTKVGKSDSMNVKLRVSTYDFKQVS